MIPLYTLTSLGKKKIYLTIPVVTKDVKQGELSNSADGRVNWYHHRKIKYYLLKLNICNTYDLAILHLEVCPSEMHIHVHQRTWTRMFITEQPQNVTTINWTNQWLCTHTTESSNEKEKNYSYTQQEWPSQTWCKKVRHQCLFRSGNLKFQTSPNHSVYRYILQC